MKPSEESASRFEGPEWDTLSETRSFGKMHPGIGAQCGTRFPREGSGEIASRSEPGAVDTVSLLKKEGALPAVDADNAPFALSFVEVLSRGCYVNRES